MKVKTKINARPTRFLKPSRSNHIIILLLILCLIPFFGISQNQKYSVKINPNKVISTYNKSMLFGTNVGVFYEESDLLNFDFQTYLHQLNPGIIRMPGGSWANELYWNGNRVRLSEESYIPENVWLNTIKKGDNPIKVAFNLSKHKGNVWEVDYSGYSPGFRVHDLDGKLSDFHGFTDVLFLHKFIQSFNAETMVTVNITSAPVKNAVEWVKWVKNRQYFARKPFYVKYWELGNELDGHWELGNTLPDGSKMTAISYIKLYKEYAIAMKKADPTIKVGGSVASNNSLPFIEELIADTSAPLDFVSFHTYPSKEKETDFITMANHATEINDAVSKIKKWLTKYRPNQKDTIEIALTEWNIKVKEDITTVDLTNTLWSSIMLGEIAKSGIDIAIQWDMFSTTETGGHGLFNTKDLTKPRSQYWANYLWNHFMGNKLIETQLQTPEHVRAYTTIDDGFVSIMIINGSKTETVNIHLDVPNSKRKLKATEITFGKEQFQLNKETLLPIKSEKPAVNDVCIKKKKGLTVAPYSVKIIRYKI